MKLSIRSIQAIGKIITGDYGISPYRTGPKLVNYFNHYGAETRYGNGFPSRWAFTEEQLERINGTSFIKEAVEESVNPAEYINTDFNVEAVVDHLNQYLTFDGLELIKNGMRYTLITKNNKIITPSFTDKITSQKDSHLFIIEQIDKCRDKLADGDYDGAITNARSMMEAVFESILIERNVDISKYEGDLIRLYREIKRYMNLEPGQIDIPETFKQVLTGLNSIVSGFSGVSNQMGDRHARKYKPEYHHALLAINSAYAFCDFLISSIEHQKKISAKKSVGLQ